MLESNLTLNPGKRIFLCVQNRAKRAGAQVSLSRLVSHPSIQTLNPFILLGEQGWLDSFLKEHSIHHQVQPWPSPRSLGARIGGLDKFARKAVGILQNHGTTIRAVVANDHQECLPALSLAKAAGNVPVIAILRTPSMTQGDFEKYHCDKCAHLFARGEELTAKVSEWSSREASCMLGSFSIEELSPPLPVPESFPTRILVAGSEEPRKGFADVLDALRIIERDEADFPSLNLVFTGNKTSQLAEQTETGFRSTFEFVGRVDGLRDFSRQFRLAIHPSRAETFGMAPFELILAGVPTIMSATGAAPSLPLTHPWIFDSGSAKALAKSMIRLWKSWPACVPDIEHLQSSILKAYPISDSAEALADKIRILSSSD